MLTQSKDIEIFRDDEKRWHIRDYGRGITYEHFTQKENKEKLTNPNIIGKFGIGLKDALATFDRQNVSIIIISAYGDISLNRAQKHDFEDIVTLHATILPPTDPNIIGTDFILTGIDDQDIEKAMQLFLKFSGELIIERSQYGEILEKNNKTANVYLNGVKVAQEENFLFSYNITSLDGKIRKALNRERTNVERSAYSDRVKAMLTASKTKKISAILVEDLKNYSSGIMHDELKWLDVQEHAVKNLNSFSKVVFVTPDEMMKSTDMIDHAKREGYEIVPVTTNLSDRVRGTNDISGNAIRVFNQYHQEYNDKFEFQFISPEKLSPREAQVYNMTDCIFDLIGGRPASVNAVKISETMREDISSATECSGLWVPLSGEIIIKRTQLKCIEDYAGTLLHEAVHAQTYASDVSRDFEIGLTKAIGILSAKLLQ